MNMSKWRLGFYCFCLMALGLASNAANTIQNIRPSTSEVILLKKSPSRSIASEVKVAIDRAAEEEILIVTPKGIIYKRTRYVESIRMQISDNKELLTKIKNKDAEIKRKAKEIQTLKGQKDVAASIIALAIKDIKSLDQDRKRLQTELTSVKRRHAQEKLTLESDITALKDQIASEQNAKATEKKQKEDALAKLEASKVEFESLHAELELTSNDLNLAEDEIERLEIVVAALSDDLEVKKAQIAEQGVKITEQDTKLTEQDTKLTEQETKISEQSQVLKDLKVAECEQKDQLEELKKQVETFETEKSDMDEVIAALKQDKIDTDKQRKEEKKQIAILLQRFSMFATLSTQQPQPQMPQVMHNPLTNSSMVDMNQYMMLAMMGNMSRTGAMNPFEFNTGNSQVNSYYYHPRDSYLNGSAVPGWSNNGTGNYFGPQAGGFDFTQDNSFSRGFQPNGTLGFSPEFSGANSAALGANRGPAYFQF